MVRLGWKIELCPGATLHVLVGPKGEMMGSKWTLRGGLRIRAASLWGDAFRKYEAR